MVKSLEGISLVEVLVALFLFSVGMLASGLMALKSLNFARDGLYQTKAIDLAQMQQETILARGLAGADSASWQARIKAVLPQGEGRISYAKGVQLNTTRVSVQVLWQPSALKIQKKRTVSVEFVCKA